MKQSIFTIKSNQKIAKDVYRMELLGDVSQITAPGQFVNVRLDGAFLRRPISVCNRYEGGFTMIYKVVGSGTAQMARLESGACLDILTGLGNGYDLHLCGDRPLLIGGGVGVPPMYWLCAQLLKQGREVTVILGFNTEEEVFFEQEFRDLGARVLIMTADGSYGTKGFVTDGMELLQKEMEASSPETKEPFYTYFYTCGPGPMFRAIEKIARTGGQYSFEERMGCGFGACMGCSLKTLTGSKRICKDGPVFRREEILW